MKAVSISKIGVNTLAILLSAQAMAATPSPIKSCTAEFKSEDGKSSLRVQAEIYAKNGSYVAQTATATDGGAPKSEEIPAKMQKFKIRPNLASLFSSGSIDPTSVNEGEMRLITASSMKDQDDVVAAQSDSLNFDVNQVRSIKIYRMDESTELTEAYDKSGKSLGSYFMESLSVAPCK